MASALGQQHARQGNTFTYCAQGRATVVFGANGRVSSVRS